MNADEILGANSDINALNLYAYCGNNPVVREDDKGNAWFASMFVGVITQYVGDVVGNVLEGKSGVEFFGQHLLRGNILRLELLHLFQEQDLPELLSVMRLQRG